MGVRPPKHDGPESLQLFAMAGIEQLVIRQRRMGEDRNAHCLRIGAELPGQALALECPGVISSDSLFAQAVAQAKLAGTADLSQNHDIRLHS